MAKRIVSIPRKFRLAGAISFRKDYSPPPSSPPSRPYRRPWDIGVNVPLPDAVRLDIVLLILWHLWKCRNTVVFDQNDSGSLDVLTRVDRDMDAWMSRYRKVSPSVQQWKVWLNHCASASPM